MRILFCFIFFTGLIATIASGQEGNRPVHLRPSADSPIIGNLPKEAFVMAPAEPVSMSDSAKAEGWEPISFLDNLRGFVKRSDVTKDLMVSPGAAVYATAEDSPNIITRAHQNDVFEVERLAGDWVEVSFRKPVIAFVPPVRNGSVTTGESSEPAPSILEEAPATAQPEAARRSTPVTSRAAIPTDGILRAYEGRLSQPRTFFGRTPVHPFQIVDSSGNRIAYLDLSRLLITTPLDHFLGREFYFYGRAEPIEGRRDFVIRVEQMRQK